MKSITQLGLATLVSSIFVPAVFAIDDNAVVVTATRTAQTVDNTMASVSIITREEIETMQATTLNEVLQQTMGIDFSQNGSYGKTTNLNLRGTNKDHVLILIDGVKIGSITTGEINYPAISLSQIERIEVVRGPRSSVYGSDAIGGVIQVFTRKGTESSKTNYKVAAGSHNTRSLNIGQSGGSKTTRFSVQAEYFNTDGIHVRDNRNPDDDGFNNNAINANLQHQLSDDSKLSFMVSHAEGDNYYDGTSAVNDYVYKFVQQVASSTLDTKVSDTWQMKMSVSQAKDHKEAFTNDVAGSIYRTRLRNASWQNDFNLSDSQLLTVGLDYQKAELESSVAYDEIQRDDKATYAQYQWFGDKHDFVVGLRSDNYSDYGRQQSGNIGWGMAISKTLRLHAAIASAFKAPTFNQQYNPSSGNPDIKPEEADSFELGLTGKLKQGQWQVNLFQNDIDNLISYVAPSYENVSEARIRGIEASLNTLVGEWKTKMNISLLDPKDTSNDTLLRRRSAQHLSIALDRSYGKWDVGASVIARSHRYNSADEQDRLAGYGLLNLRTAYNIDRNLSIRAKVDNALDKEYETLETYNMAGSTFMISVNFSE